MTVRLVDPRVDPEPEGWADFHRQARLHPVWDYGLLTVEAWLSRHPPLLAVVRGPGGITAAMAVMVCRPWLSTRYAPPPRRRWPRPVWAEVYQPWLSGFPGAVFADGLDDAARRDATRAVERALARRLGLGLLGVLYRAVGEDLAPVLAGRGRRVRRTDPTTVLDNGFATEGEWLASLSKSRRSGLKRQLRALEADDDLVIRGAPGRDDLDAVEVAAMINRHRAGFGRMPLDTRTAVSAAYLERFLPRPDVHTLSYHDRKGRLLAVHTLLDHPERPVSQHWAALRDDEGGRPGLYFDNYARAVKFVVRQGRPSLSAGRGMLDVKRSLGFVTRPVHSVLVPRPAVGR